MQSGRTTKVQITGDTRLNKVLDNVPGALEYIVSLNPHDFSRLKNPIMRKYMSPRISLRRVAAMAGVDEEELLSHLRALAGDQTICVTDEAPQPRTVALPRSPRNPPTWMAQVDEERIHWVNLLPVDDVLGDPMLPVTVAVRKMQPGQTIGIRHRWEPQPLYDIWQKMNLQWFARRVSPDEWHIFVHKPVSDRQPVPGARAGANSRPVMLELRHLPEREVPARVLVAFEQLEPGESLELWVEPGGADKALAALQQHHAGEFTWGRQQVEAGKEIILVSRLAPGRVTDKQVTSSEEVPP